MGRVEPPRNVRIFLVPSGCSPAISSRWGADAERVEDPQGAGVELALFPSIRRGAQHPGHEPRGYMAVQPLEHVVERRQLGEERHLLEGAGDAVARAVVAREVGHVPPAQEHLSARGRQGARDDVEVAVLLPARSARRGADELALRPP